MRARKPSGEIKVHCSRPTSPQAAMGQIARTSPDGFQKSENGMVVTASYRNEEPGVDAM